MNYSKFKLTKENIKGAEILSGVLKGFYILGKKRQMEVINDLDKRIKKFKERE